MIARETHYHTSCRKNYTRADDKHEHCDKDERVVEELNAHLSADMSGNKARDEFIEDRLLKKTASFFDPVKKQRLKTLASLAKCVKLTGSEKKSQRMRAERNIFDSWFFFHSGIISAWRKHCVTLWGLFHGH